LRSKKRCERDLVFSPRKQEGENDTAFKEQGLRAVSKPFWRNLPYSNIFTAFTPDLLHQLHKGVFKDHLVKWCTEIVGKDELDSLFRDIPSHPGLRHFTNGISHVSQWTGTEHKEMEKVFLALVASGKVDDRVVKAVRALTDFIHYASLQSHTSHTLLALRKALDDFHTFKSVFIELQARSPAHFNIPKVHSLDHYEDLIRLFGSADGFNTESPERLHIDYAKNAYRATNHKDYIPQMTTWLRRQEAIDYFSAYLLWTQEQDPVSTNSPPSDPQEELEELVITSTAYSLAKQPPPATRKVLAKHIISPEGHGAARFLPALSAFLLSHGCAFVPHDFDVFSLWKQIVFKLPKIPEVGARHSRNVVRAIGVRAESIGAGRRTAAVAAQLDFALVKTGEANPHTDGTALQG
jgi:hypothetical protein